MTSRKTLIRWLSACLLLATATSSRAADHLDTPTVIADPAADIGDLYAWTSADGRRLNLVMDIVGQRFSDQIQYVFHVDSGPAFGRTTASMTVGCRFDRAGIAQCWADHADRVQGDVGDPRGLDGLRKRMRVFAGVRDDPYFNNVRGTRAALNAAGDAIRQGKAPKDASGFHRFDDETLALIRERWTQTNGGPAMNFLAGWKTSALVISVDLAVVSGGGPMLAVWATTERRQPAPADDGAPPTGAPIDRMGRALTGNALLGTLAEDDIADQLKEAYNRADRQGWAAFETEIARNLALYDSFDGIPGNQWLADMAKPAPERYRRLARLLADDRLWVDSRQTRCDAYLAVERSAFGEPIADCGGRTPNHNVNGVFRSLLIRGTPDRVDDGVAHDDRQHSTVDFPFLAAPAGATDSKIALANLDALIRQNAGEPASIDLVLLRMQFAADYAALDRVAELTERGPASVRQLLQRAKARAAAHRFAQALEDLDAAARAGAGDQQVQSQRASIWVATGRAEQALPWLRARQAARPGFATRFALARGEAAAGRLEEADTMYAAALQDLDTTSPFPEAALCFARAQMWAEQGGDPTRGEGLYREALRLVPQFVAARVHLAELLAARGDASGAAALLEPVAEASGEPQALALLSAMHSRIGQPHAARREIGLARQRFDALLAKHPLAFADHAAEFYLGVGDDAKRALSWAQMNVSGRQTRRAHLLLLRALRMNGRDAEARSLEQRIRVSFDPRAA
ncbi:MAG TPA: tetratricopeptide repeat protein [Albitalea sp.]|nr:tetratricopeptide repeat protein [Albitalea sp.]